MLLSDFTASINLVGAGLTTIWYALDNVTLITSPAMTLLDFLVGMMIIDEALDIILMLKED